MENEKEQLNIGTKLTVCFDDKAKGKNPITLENPTDKYLKELNEKGFGIFETANSFFATPEQLKELASLKGKEKVTKRNKEFLTHLNEVFADIDVCNDADKLPEEERENKKTKLKDVLDNYCPASVYVITKNGLQPHWWINEDNTDEATQRKYVCVVNGVIEYSKQNGAKGDPVKDVTRVLRKPGYYHHKSEPYLIIEEKGNGKVYTLDELKEYFWHESNVKMSNQQKDKSEITYSELDSIDICQVAVDVWKEIGHEASFDKEGRLIIDGVTTATFKGRLGGNYLATTSGDYPAKGNAVTYVAETLGIDTKEAFKWLCKIYKIDKFHSNMGQFEAITAEELCNQEFSPTEWMIQRLIPENQITVVSGAPSSYKTMSILQWALSIVSGGKAYDNFDTTKCAVLLVSTDGDNKRIIRKRLLFLTEKPGNNFFLMIGSRFKLEEKEVNNLLEFIKKHEIKFIIFDSFRGIMPVGKEENDAGAVREVINRLRPLTIAGATILVTHHDRKKPMNTRGYRSTDPNDLGEMMSGSVDIRGAVDSHLAMSAGKNKDGGSYIIVTQTKCREEDLLPAFKVSIKTEKDGENKTIKMLMQYDGEFKLDNAEETMRKAKEAILDFLMKSGDRNVWRDVIISNKPGGFASRKLDEALKDLEQVDKKISSLTGKELGMNGSESRRKFYFLKDDDGVDEGQIQDSLI